MTGLEDPVGRTFKVPPLLVNGFPPIRSRRVLILRLTAFAFVVFRNEGRSQMRWADVAAQKNESLGATLRAPPRVSDRSTFFERMTD